MQRPRHFKKRKICSSIIDFIERPPQVTAWCAIALPIYSRQRLSLGDVLTCPEENGNASGCADILTHLYAAPPSLL